MCIKHLNHFRKKCSILTHNNCSDRNSPLSFLHYYASDSSHGTKHNVVRKNRPIKSRCQVIKEINGKNTRIDKTFTIRDSCKKEKLKFPGVHENQVPFFDSAFEKGKNYAKFFAAKDICKSRRPHIDPVQVAKAQPFLPSDDKLLVLPLLRLPHQVQQPKYARENYQKAPSHLNSHPFKLLSISKHTLVNWGNKCQNSPKSVLAKSYSWKSGSLTKVKKMEGIDIIREIGRGSYGSVWLVRRLMDEKILVLKSVNLSHLSPEQEESARQEVHILAGLKHPNIVSYKGSFELDHHLHLLMTYCEGGDLFTKIRQQCGALFSEQQIVRWLIQITMALQYLHSHNILHRDLKTQNIFLTRSGLIKLGDFGIAKVLNSSIEMATTMIGTPYYMSPELFAGIPYSYKSDIWSLGCCLYEMSTLKHAFHARDMSALICRISRGKVDGISVHYTPDLRGLIYSLMNRTPNLRPSASQILQKPFIRDHISAFLKDTSNQNRVIVRREIDASRQNCKLMHKDSISEGKHDCEKQIETIKPNLYARRCCEVLPTEFESLHISGDKIKLEDRSRVESKPNGSKECNCERRDRKTECTVSHIGSQSRRRRRIVRKFKDSELDTKGKNIDNIPANDVQDFQVRGCPAGDRERLVRPSSARERRRQKRIQEMDNESSKEVADKRDINEDECSISCRSQEGNTTSEEQDSSEVDSPRHNEISSPEESSSKFEDDDEFVSILDTTLSESSGIDKSEFEAGSFLAGEESMDLQSRLLMLEETLLNVVGKDSFAEITSLLKSGSWEDWEEQRELLSRMLDQNFAPVATTLCHLKLCYCFLQD